MIGSCNCPITGVGLQPMSNYNFADYFLQNTAAHAPITFEKIVIVMIDKANWIFYLK